MDRTGVDYECSPTLAAALAQLKAVLATWLRALAWAAAVLAVPAVLVVGAKVWLLGPAAVLPVSAPLWAAAVFVVSALRAAGEIQDRRSASVRR